MTLSRKFRLPRVGRGEAQLNVEHVSRPDLPWRRATHTECGIPKANHPCITRDDFMDKVEKQGAQRAMLTTCQTCMSTAERHPDWEESPALAIQREVEGWGGRAKNRRDVISMELIAMATLVALHREEFDELLEDQRAIVSIDSAKGRAS